MGIGFNSSGSPDSYTVTISFESGALFSDGTAASPSIANIGDTNSGVYWPAADTLAVSLGGSETVRFTTTGVLINSTTGAQALKVQGMGSATVGEFDNSSGAAMVYSGTASLTPSSGESGTNAMLYVRQDGTTSRSINAAGTVNASGADYAEYETKSDGCGDVAKGDIVGYNAEGKLTDVFANSISFGVKSSDPSYVGGDKWGAGLDKPEFPDVSELHETEAAEVMIQYEGALQLFHSELESRRQFVDRIAYAGKVPVNGLTADNSSVGDKVLAVADGDGIKAQAKATPTLSEYMKKCVGTILCYGEDGRAIIDVKRG